MSTVRTRHSSTDDSSSPAFRLCEQKRRWNIQNMSTNQRGVSIHDCNFVIHLLLIHTKLFTQSSLTPRSLLAAGRCAKLMLSKFVQKNNFGFMKSLDYKAIFLGSYIITSE
ncbi:hypothetical protein CDAR_391331 [Caerostris darwini]|uniref:Uncharacterized protein n=1 Tax=Caerostris darwini TaxID=1538125 RepID=A0AAV4W7T7_9ARAC|nr:hypothetical protein CDAR_391331 [Caerostris darwini]